MPPLESVRPRQTCESPCESPRASFRFEGPHVARPALQFVDEVIAGLCATSKALEAKHLYDARGSALFEEITRTPEYYLTRVEAAILRAHGPRIAQCIGTDVTVVELGAGSEVKALELLKHLQRPRAWLPLDVSVQHLEAAVARFVEVMPQVLARASAGDFLRSIAVALPEPTDKVVVFFPGSTLGNLSDEDARALLRAIQRAMRPGDGLLIGTDLVKDVEIMNAAYFDAAGVTTRFIKNVLVRVKSELGLEINAEDFDYQARWNPALSRMEMRLHARRELRVPPNLALGSPAIDFEAQEAIYIEGSRKYTLEDLQTFATATGFRVAECFTDPVRPYALSWWTV